MIAYTVQPLQQYHQLKEKGYLEGTQERMWELFHKQYQWMLNQMTQKIPTYHGETYPIWVYQKKPDRNIPHLLPKGTKGVILKLELSDEEALWSCGRAWQKILQNKPILGNRAEWEEFKKTNTLDSIEKTWTRMFDFNWLNSPENDLTHTKQKWIQGVTPRITPSHLIKVERFIAK
ncbi:DUF3841 domain-containing protein [Gottfriedia solisilvae]|uniref:DUF3841 domain-containing protein n=1 Tax=Gottfriedia solisilvae TaxID=1516104 RepID=UPI003D2F28EA